MTPIIIQAGQQSYEALVGSGLLERAGSANRSEIEADRDCAIVSDENVAALFAEPVERA